MSSEAVGLPRPVLLARLRTGRWPDVLGVAWLVLFVLLYLSPALKDGPSFAPADLGRGLSLLTSLGGLAQPNHNVVNGDIITQAIPWNTLDWQAIHHGQLPLWNSLAGTGLPQLLNFESGVFALPSIVGYLFPLSIAFLVTVGVKLLIAGTGAYVLCRLLKTGPLSAAFAGTTAMLSGAFAGWLGWSVSGPLAWSGWILAACVLCYRSRGRAIHVALLAIVVAFAIYGGFPESYVLLAGAVAVVLLVTGAVTLAVARRVRSAGVARIALGTVAGLALSAPLWLPGIPVLRSSARNGKDAASGLPLHAVLLLFAQGFYGLPIRGSYWFGPVNYFETAAYVGVAAIVLAGVAVLVSWRRPVVLGLFAGAVACLLVVYKLGSAGPVQQLVKDLGLGAIALQRALPLLGLAIAVLSGLGLEIVVRRWREPVVRRFFAASTAVLVLVLAVLADRISTASMPAADAAAYPASAQPSPSTLESLRRASLIWPAATVVLLALVCAACFVLARRDGARRCLGGLIGALLLGTQSAFLLFAGVGINSYASSEYPVTPAVAELQSIVGTKLLGLDAGNVSCDPPALAPPDCGVRYWQGIGFYPEMNIGYGIDELGLHDPTIPQSYFDAWPVANADQVYGGNLNIFVPAIDSVTLARRYGVAYVLAAPKQPPPVGMRLVTTIRNADEPNAPLALYSVPGAARFAFTGSGAGASVTSVAHPGNASYTVHVRVDRPSELVARITDVPGWHVSANGHNLVVRKVDRAFVGVTVPAGTQVISLHYWPPRLSDGFVAALIALVALVAASAAGALKRRGSSGTGRRTVPALSGASSPPEGGGESGSPLLPSAGGE